MHLSWKQMHHYVAYISSEVILNDRDTADYEIRFSKQGQAFRNSSTLGIYAFHLNQAVLMCKCAC